ncbi:hypothetical protein GCM10017322_38640 [Paracoccus aerius]|nr:hypothetical protein GCM10017322_38640 [Paracoccus aerius]
MTDLSAILVLRATRAAFGYQGGRGGETVLKTVYLPGLTPLHLHPQIWILRAMFSVREVGEDARLQFEAAVYRLGQGKARSAFSRAMNHETAKARTRVNRVLRRQTGIKVGDISRATKFLRAYPNKLQAEINAQGDPFPLKHFRARQFKYGVRANPWNTSRRFPGSFIIRSIDGNVFHRTGKLNSKSGRMNAIEKMWGPSLPREIMQPDPLREFDMGGDAVLNRAMHELRRILDGA